MQAIDLNKPGEKKKLIWASALGLGAIVVLWYVFFGFGSSTPSRTPSSNANTRAAASSTPARPQTAAERSAQNVSPAVADLAQYAPIKYDPTSYSAPEAKRNIFAYYVPPPKPSPTIQVSPTPPPPPPPLLLASVSPS